MLEDLFKIRLAEHNINNTLPIARPGIPYILGLALVFLVSLFFEWCVVSVIFLILTIFTTWFFRDPNRVTPPGTFGISPADGMIIRIDDTAKCPLTGVEALKVSIFMNLFSVHVNRVPISGNLVRQDYYPGAFINASFDKASTENERNCLIIEDEKGHRITMVQIAGLVARRIACWVNIGQNLKRGQRYGLIRFGSRVDLYLPKDVEIMVALGQNVYAGSSPIWRFKD
ncbi:MAG: phosphatidylserine decarboxylase family protein [Deltaproteobacteria bacterium]|jgi:phosphatidylserine decarboxylase|nr:phosphatidylserine decarboxylase family protein [Deltaproteobacteria bacterium]